MKININQKAPIIARQKLKIHAPAVKVWNILTGINEWPDWQSSVSQARMENTASEGEQFTWKTGGSHSRSSIHTCERFHAFGMTEKRLGAYNVQNWHFETVRDGTIVSVEESMQGILPNMFKRSYKKKLETDMSLRLRELKSVSES